jgi:hypothetical protein
MKNDFIEGDEWDAYVTLDTFSTNGTRDGLEMTRPEREAAWIKRMVARRRKTLVVCHSCHEAIHRERPKRH